MKFPKVSRKVVAVVVIILIVLFFLRRGEGYDINQMKRAVTEAGVSIPDENIIGPILEKGPGKQTGEELNTLRKILDKYPGLGQKIEAIAVSTTPAPTPTVANIMTKTAVKAEQVVPRIPTGFSCKFN